MISRTDVQTTESVAVPQPGVSPMGAIWRTIRGYILWSYERGSLHYDVMVTLILLFVFVSPYFINFNDKPVERNPHPTGVVVFPTAEGGFIYEIPAKAITERNGIDIRQQMLQIIEPVSGAVSISKFEAVKDSSGRVQVYRVWIEKE